ncbi:MAG: NADH-ubiquinone oxidoreductase-F iron-sulfur binding region domain-containing protein [Geodermatophilaceae bacterium]
METLLDTCDNILGRSFCAFGDGATSPITSSIQYFRDDYIALLPDSRAGQADRWRPHDGHPGADAPPSRPSR